MKNIILASKSPRRKELMGLLNVNFEVMNADIDETLDKNVDLEEALIILANKKAMEIFKNHSDSIVIGSDSIVYQDNTILNKPKNKEDAYRMIKSYSDSHHDVITSVSIVDKNQTINFVSKCRVYFNLMSEGEIKAYLQFDEYKDKAGAYAIQGLMSKHISRVDGDFYSVVGFPIAKVYEILKDNFNVFD